MRTGDDDDFLPADVIYIIGSILLQIQSSSVVHNSFHLKAPPEICRNATSTMISNTLPG